MTTTLTRATALDTLIGHQVRITRTMPTGVGATATEVTVSHVGTLVDAFHDDVLDVVGTLDEEPRGACRGGVGSLHLPYGSTVEIIEAGAR